MLFGYRTAQKRACLFFLGIVGASWRVVELLVVGEACWMQKCCIVHFIADKCRECVVLLFWKCCCGSDVVQ